MSLKAYLEQFRGKTEDWAIDLLDVAYNIEFGLLTEDQSSLVMVDFIGTDMSKPFQMFGESDEMFRIKGGSSALIKALVAALENKIEMKQGYALTALDHKDGKIVMSFDAPGGPASESYDAVILALPFTKLRQVKGLESLELGEEKLKCIRELGYGHECQDHARHHIARVAQRRMRDCQRHRTATSLPISASRTFTRQAAPSRARPASSPTSWASRRASLTRSPRSTSSAPSLPKMSQKMAESLDPSAVISWFWASYPFTLGSYASAKVGPIHHVVGGGGGARS